MSSAFWGPEEYDRRAQRLYERGEYDEALRLLGRGLDLFPDAPELLVSLGYVQLAREEFPWARRAFEAGLAEEPDHEDGLVGLGETLLRMGERTRALRAFERVLELGFDRDVDLMLSIGRALAREELYERAERFLRLATVADEGCAEAAAELAVVLHRRGEGRWAREWLERALAIDPGAHEARAFLGTLLYEAGRREAALRELEKIPTGYLWDPLVVWRIIELLRAYRRPASVAAEIDPYLERLEQLVGDPDPVERLLAEVESAAEGAAPRGPVGQLDLFRPEADAASPRDGEPGPRPSVSRSRPAQGHVHEVRTPEAVFAGDWAGIVRAMCDSSGRPGQSLEEFMRETARRVHDLTGILIPDHDPEAFLKASARAGVLHIDR